MAYRYFAAGYLVKDNKVLLAHHVKFDKWTPPGGHIESDETPNQAVIREWKEEVSVDIEVIPAYESAFSGDANAAPIPMPFHIDLEREGFEVPHIGFFFYIKLKDEGAIMDILKKEIHDIRWFSKEEITQLKTFDQVKALASFAIDNYPKSQS